MGAPLTLPSQFPGIQSPYSIPRYSQCCSIAGPVNTEHPQLWPSSTFPPWRYHLYCILLESCLILTEFQISDMSRIVKSIFLQYRLVADKISKVWTEAPGCPVGERQEQGKCYPVCNAQSRVLCPTPCNHLLHHAISQITSAPLICHIDACEKHSPSFQLPYTFQQGVVLETRVMNNFNN